MRLSTGTRVAIVFFVFSCLWVFLTNRWLILAFKTETLQELIRLQDIKGIIFSAFTATLLYLTFNYFIKRITRSREQYAQLFEVNPNPMWVYDTGTLKFLAVNKAAIRHYGYSEKEFLSMTIADIRPSEDLPKLQKHLREIPDDYYSSGHWRHIRKNGEMIYVRISSHPIQFMRKKAELILSVDVTQQVLYEQDILELNSSLELKIRDRTHELQESIEEMETLNEELAATNEELRSTNEELIAANEVIHEQNKVIELQNRDRLNDLMESVSDIFIVVDYDYTVLRVNRAFENAFEFERGKVVGKNMHMIFPNLNEHIILEYFKLATLEQKTVLFEIFIEKLNAHMRIRIYPAKEGLIVFAVNINEEVKRKQEVMLSKKNLESLINNTTDMIWSIDRHGNLLSANQAFIENTYKQHGVKLKPGDFMMRENVDIESVDQWREICLQVLNGQSLTKEYSSSDSDNPRHLIVHCNPILDDNYAVIGAGFFAFDITNQKKYELERADMITKLTSQNKNLEEFSYIISHNLRSPVASIKGLVNVIQQGKTNDSEMLDMLMRSATRLDEVISDLNKVLETKDHSLGELELVNFEDILRNIKELLHEEISSSHAKIEYDFSRLPFIRSSKPYLNSILFNLVANGMKYTQENDKPVISIVTYKSNDFFHLEVKDCGMGIDLEKFGNKLFKMYQRFHLHKTGKGIGLYLVKTQVEALRGKIDVESAPGKGTTFKIMLPVTSRHEGVINSAYNIS